MTWTAYRRQISNHRLLNLSRLTNSVRCFAVFLRSLPACSSVTSQGAGWSGQSLMTVQAHRPENSLLASAEGLRLGQEHQLAEVFGTTKLLEGVRRITQ